MQKVIASGVGDSSLFLELNFVNSGSLSFTFRANVEGDSSFVLYMDNVQIFYLNQTQLEYNTFSINVNTGKHVFRWRVIGGSISTPTTPARLVKIGNIVAIGTKTSSGSQLPCLQGQYSSPGSTKCSICPSNTWSSAASSECIPCLLGQYALPESSRCDDQPICSNVDYQQFFTPCEISTLQRTSYYMMAEPVICRNPQLPPNTTISCSRETMHCPTGEIATTSDDNLYYVCKPCGQGTYPDSTQSSCIPVPAGSYAFFVSNYFSDNLLVSRSTLPTGFETGCVGMCGTKGWRVINVILFFNFHFFFV